MRTLVFANQKGGVGKSTLAAHCGVALERAGKGRVVLLDLDPQGSLSEWWNSRQAATPQYSMCASVAELPAKLEQLAKAGFDWCVIDTPPSVGPTLEAAVRVADLVVVPIQAGSFDLRAAPKTVELFERLARPFVFVLNRVKGGKTTASLQAIAALAPVAPVLGVISDRVIYGAVTQDGRTVFDLASEAKAAGEQAELMQRAIERFPEHRPAPAKREKALA